MVWWIRQLNERPRTVLLWSLVVWFALVVVSALPAIDDRWFLWLPFVVLKAIPAVGILLACGSLLEIYRRDESHKSQEPQ